VGDEHPPGGECRNRIAGLDPRRQGHDRTDPVVRGCVDRGAGAHGVTHERDRLPWKAHGEIVQRPLGIRDRRAVDAIPATQAIQQPRNDEPATRTPESGGEGSHSQHRELRFANRVAALGAPAVQDERDPVCGPAGFIDNQSRLGHAGQVFPSGGTLSVSR